MTDLNPSNQHLLYAHKTAERDALVVLVAAVGEVHANNVETIVAELVQGLDGVGLGSDCTDDGGTAKVASWLKLGVELCQPADGAATS